MKTVIPDFYKNFMCKAGDCKHSCCKGWEIDIDEDSAAYYQTITSDFGKKLANSIYTDEEGAHFKLTSDERCPFLREDNLCEMILEIGEESLCDICALHPRFFEDYTLPSNNYFEPVELAGVGLSCEKVCELLWESNAPLRFYFCDEEGFETEREFHFDIQSLTYRPNLEKDYVSNLLLLFQKTEAIDETWTVEISELINHIDDVINKAKQKETTYDGMRYQRLFHYIAYRQLESIEDTKALTAYASRCTDFVFLWDAYFSGKNGYDTQESIRRFSEQIEYSTENVNLILRIES